MKNELVNQLSIVALLIGAAPSFAASRSLVCTGTLDTARSTVAAHYLEQDRAYYGIDRIELRASSVNTSSLESDTPATVSITGTGGRIINDQSEQNLVRVIVTTLGNRFNYTTLRPAPYFTKVSNTYFASVNEAGRGILELDMTSGTHRRYRFDLVCK